MSKKITKEEFLSFISGMPNDTEFEMIEKIVYSCPPVYIWTVNFTFDGLNLDEWRKEFNRSCEHQEPNTNNPDLTIRLTDIISFYEPNIMEIEKS